MKLKTQKSLTVEVTGEEIASLLTRLIEKKTGKKVYKVDAGGAEDPSKASPYVFELAPEEEVTNLDESK